MNDKDKIEKLTELCHVLIDKYIESGHELISFANSEIMQTPEPARSILLPPYLALHATSVAGVAGVMKRELLSILNDTKPPVEQVVINGGGDSILDDIIRKKISYRMEYGKEATTLLIGSNIFKQLKKILFNGGTKDVSLDEDDTVLDLVVEHHLNHDHLSVK